MDLEGELRLIGNAIAKMNETYGRPVFDEWAVVQMRRPARLLSYEGPRGEDFEVEMQEDLAHLRAELDKAGDMPGEFAFSREGEGTGVDAFIYLGSDCYLLCNNTDKSMTEVTADPQWLKAQGAFVNLSEQVQGDPLSV